MSWRTIRAKGKLRPRGQMNKTEAAYADHLKMLERTGVIAWFAYEAIKFRLANNTFYTPDFLVMLSDGQLEVPVGPNNPEQHGVQRSGYLDLHLGIIFRVVAFPFSSLHLVHFKLAI